MQAPEVIKGEDYDTTADIWSLGALLFELLTGSPPYSEYPPLRALFLIASKGLPAPPLTWSDELLDFLDQCTVMEAKDRSTAAMLLEVSLRPCEAKQGQARPEQGVPWRAVVRQTCILMN